ncbi:MAG: oligosaccharide flippase family protein [Candidatus Pacebacteria bacterium]|nr:oligosaccharide flippase family protein [Candidatus Paceibacterota bacterium]
MPVTQDPLLKRLILWAERITKIDLSYLLKGGVWLVLGQVSISGLAFLASIAFAYYVSKDDYGTYRFLLSVFWSLTAFGLSGVPTALARAIARDDHGAYWHALKLSLLGSIPMAIISFGMSAYYALNANPLLAYGCLAIGILGPFMQAAYLYGAVLEGKKAFRENAVAGILLNLVPTLGLIALMLILHEPVAFLATFLGASVLTGTLISIYTIRKFHISFTRKTNAEFHSLGLHLSAMNILFTLSQQADKLLIFHALGPVNLAIYTFAVSIPDQLRAILGNLETLSFPKFAKRPVHEILPTLGKKLWGLTGIIILIVICYIVAAPFLFSILFPAYMDSVLISQVYALSLIPVGSVVPLSLLQAHAAKRELYIFNTVIPILQIFTLWMGILFMGLLGAILARVLTRFATMALSLILVKTYALRHS